MLAKPFWFVWCPTARPPQYRHETEQSAKTEAQRLARTYPGSRFVVLESVCAYEVNAVQETVFSNDADIPF